MKIYEVEINTHDLADENYSVKNGRRYMFVTKELAAELVFKNMKAQYFLGGGNIVATRQMLLDNVNDSSWYSIRQYIKAEPNEPGDCFDLKGLVAGCKIEVSLHGDVIVCVDGKVEEEPIVEDEPIVIDEEPLVIDESGIVHQPEPHVIEQDINQSQEPKVEPKPIPQSKPKRKRSYPQVGEPTLRANNDGTVLLMPESSPFSAQKILTYALTVLLIAAVSVLLFSLLGAGVFLLPLLCGAFSK